MGLVLVLGAAAAGAGEPPVRFRGWIASIGGPAAMSGQRTWVRLHADAFTSEETVVKLTRILAEQGEDALLKAIEDLPSVGWIAIGPNTRTELKLIRSVGDDQIRHLRFLADRPIQYAEMWTMSRSRDYHYGFVELVVDGKGEGDGTIIPAAKIELEDGKVHLTSLGIEPFRILQVSPEKIKDQDADQDADKDTDTDAGEDGGEPKE